MNQCYRPSSKQTSPHPACVIRPYPTLWIDDGGPSTRVRGRILAPAKVTSLQEKTYVRVLSFRYWVSLIAAISPFEILELRSAPCGCGTGKPAYFHTSVTAENQPVGSSGRFFFHNE